MPCRDRNRHYILVNPDNSQLILRREAVSIYDIRAWKYHGALTQPVAAISDFKHALILIHRKIGHCVVCPHLIGFLYPLCLAVWIRPWYVNHITLMYVWNWHVIAIFVEKAGGQPIVILILHSCRVIVYPDCLIGTVYVRYYENIWTFLNGLSVFLRSSFQTGLRAFSHGLRRIIHAVIEFFYTIIRVLFSTCCK